MNQAKRGVDQLLLSMKSVTTTASAAQDCIGARYATVRIVVGTRLVTNPAACTISLLESDDTVVSNYATIVADRAEVLASVHHEVRYEVDLRSRKRFLKLIVTPGTTASNDAVVLVALATLTRNESDPSAAAGLVATTNDAVVVV